MIKFVKTCDACPEQYDAFLGEERVGYLRLRHGIFYVVCPDVGGVPVYEAAPDGDGAFDDDERDYYLRFAADAILKWVAAGRPKARDRASAPNVEYEVK